MAEQENNRLFLLDAMALIYRAYFAFIRNPLINSKGMNTSAVSGFTSTLMDLINREKPTHIAVVFDTMAPTERAVEHDFYKANREETPRDIVVSIPFIKEIVKAFHIPVLEQDGYEADDIIGTLAKKAEHHGYTVYMVTPDKDFGQLVSDNIFIYKPPYQGRGSFDTIGVPEVLDRWDIDNVSQVIDILGLMGDSVDNIPGIPGVGEKTAVKLLKEFGSVENLLENTDKLKGKLQERVTEHANKALISKKLATIICDVPVKWDEEDLVMSKPDKKKLAELFNELEFRTLGRRILGDDFSVTQRPADKQMDLFGNVVEEKAGKTEEKQNEIKINQLDISNTSHEYIIVQALPEIRKLADQLLTEKELCFDTETTGLDPHVASLVGISFSAAAHKAFYIPFPEDKKHTKEILDILRPVFENKDILKIGQNLKYDMLVLMNQGIDVKGSMFDTMVAHYLLEPDMRHKMDILSETYLGYSPVPIENLIGKKGKNQMSMRDVDLETIKEYAAEDADITLQLKKLFAPALEDKGVVSLFEEVEMPLVKTLAMMEHTGVALDTDFLHNYSKELEKEISGEMNSIYDQAGVKFNIDSPKQLGEVLFIKLKIPYQGRKTKTGQYATNEEVLSRLASEYDICDHILTYRQLVKLKSTYVDALPGLVNNKTGRIHTTFNQTVANTGRLSSQNPNLQNIPIRTERGREVRKAFIPRNGDYTILSADYSQIELRIIAALSHDDAMISAFKDGLDIHTATASKVYETPLDDVTADMRRNAKMVNFGIIYGISAFGLSQRLNISRNEAGALINHYFRQYPGIKKYMDDSIQFARDNGFVATILGRRRYLKDIKSGNSTVRGFAERNAINMPIQGSAADMIKVAMINVDKEMKLKNLKSRMTLQVHDELVFDAYKPELETLKSLVAKNMKEAIKLDVPIEVEMGTGNNWLEAH